MLWIILCVIVLFVAVAVKAAPRPIGIVCCFTAQKQNANDSEKKSLRYSRIGLNAVGSAQHIQKLRLLRDTSRSYNLISAYFCLLLLLAFLSCRSCRRKLRLGRKNEISKRQDALLINIKIFKPVDNVAAIWAFQLPLKRNIQKR